MARHYPERLGYALIISAPWLFNATWTAMKTFVDPVTVAKVRFVKVRRSFLLSTFPPLPKPFFIAENLSSHEFL